MAGGPQRMVSGQVGRLKSPLVEEGGPGDTVTKPHSHGQ